MKCQQCGCENKENALFCAKCGKALKEQPIALDLQQIKIPAAARKARIVKVNAKKSEAAAQQTDAPTPPEAEGENENELASAVQQPQQEPDAPQQPTQPEESAAESLIPLTPPEEVQGAPVPSATPTQDDPTLAPMKKRNWLAVFILGAIPCVNLIMLLIWSFSPRTNKSKKSYAQMSLILMLIGFLLAVAAVITIALIYKGDYTEIMKQISFLY